LAGSAHGPWSRTGRTDIPIQTLQHLLRARGHDVAADGIFGPGTEAAVRAFQAKPRVREATAKMAAEPAGGSPAEFGTLLGAQLSIGAEWSRMQESKCTNDIIE
jgi:peptidoglycan hydrolase-like protein with peptidoglycan-binding domain